MVFITIKMFIFLATVLTKINISFTPENLFTRLEKDDKW